MVKGKMGYRDVLPKSFSDGVCSVEDIDKAIIYGPGMRMAVTGQIMTMSLGVRVD